ncbi:MAG TPA: hypothetical protein VIL42_11760 [Sphingomicrobium sp.]|jgi:hypothetical protein
MNGDDRGSGPEWPINRRRDRIETTEPVSEPRPEPARRTRSRTETRVESRRNGINPIYIALGGVVLLLLLLWLFVGRGNSDQDKLTGAESSNAAAAADPEKLCGSKQTYDLIKRELFRRAAQVRGSDQAAFDRLSAYASLRMQNPVMESEDGDNGRVNCSGSLALDLPPGVAAVGGRRTLSSDIDYTVQPAADGSGNVVLLRNADSIVTPLATLARTSQPAAVQTDDADDTAVDEGADAPDAVPAAPSPPPVAPSPAPAAPQTTSARPSFNCANASTRSERAVCSDSGLASLDRQMASQFNRALSDAGPRERALLQQTRGRFLNYRERCGSDACIAEAYRGRMREIRDIANGDWSP